DLRAGGGDWLTAESQATNTRNSSRGVSKRSRVDIGRNMDSILIADISVETTKRWYAESLRGWLTRWMAQTAATRNTSLTVPGGSEYINGGGHVLRTLASVVSTTTVSY